MPNSKWTDPGKVTGAKKLAYPSRLNGGAHSISIYKTLVYNSNL